MLASWDTKPESWEETLLRRWAAMPPGGGGCRGRLLRWRYEEEEEVGECGWEPPPHPTPELTPPPDDREALLWALLQEEDRGMEE